MSEKSKKKLCSFRIDQEVLKIGKELSDQSKRTLTQLITDLILKEYKKQEKK